MELVKSRWADTKSIDVLQIERENLIKKTQEVIKECWKLKNISKSIRDTQTLRTISMAVEQLRRLQELDLLPDALDESDKAMVFKMAQWVNHLPKNVYKEAMKMIEAEIAKKGGNGGDFAY